MDFGPTGPSAVGGTYVRGNSSRSRSDSEQSRSFPIRCFHSANRSSTTATRATPGRALRLGVASAVLLPASEGDDQEEGDGGLEGALLRKLQRARERRQGLAKKRKKKMRDELGQLTCEVCDLTEAGVAGRSGADTGDVFECHHTKPLHTLTTATKTRVADLAVLCPNCHRAIHRTEPMPSVGEMRARSSLS